MLRLTLAFACLFSTTLSIAQITEAKGKFGVTDMIMIEEMILTMPGFESNTKAMLSEQSVRSYMMPPRKTSIKGCNSCYPLASLLEFYINYDNNYKINLSPDYIYLNLTDDTLEEALNFLGKEGTVSASIMPYDAQDIPNSTKSTAKFKIKHFLHVFKAAQPARSKIFNTRKALMRGNPILVEMKVPANFESLKSIKNYVPSGDSNTQKEILTVVSYDADLEAFEVQGAWGNQWGTNGYLWIDYVDFAKMVTDGFVLVPEFK